MNVIAFDECRRRSRARLLREYALHVGMSEINRELRKRGLYDLRELIEELALEEALSAFAELEGKRDNVSRQCSKSH